MTKYKEVEILMEKTETFFKSILTHEIPTHKK